MFKFGSKKDVSTEYKCTIRLLDDNEVLQCDYTKEHKGQHLLDYCYKNLNLLEKDYFGLRYVDTHKQRNWLDPTRSVVKQLKGLNPIVLCFRVKFYPADPSLLKEEVTRYFLYLQLRRDLLHGRLYCSSSDAAILMAYLGDYCPEEHLNNYIAEFKLALNQTPKLEQSVMEIHQKEMHGQTPAVAELNFLKKAYQLETYGIDPHPVKDHKGNQLYLGVNYSGIITFQGSRKSHHFKWYIIQPNEIQKITYEGRMFIVHLSVSEKKHLIGFKCPTVAACHFLWRCAVEQRYFFTYVYIYLFANGGNLHFTFRMSSSSDVPFVTTGGGLFSKSCKLHYSGRVEKEIINDMKNVERKGSSIQRSYSTTSAPPSMRALGRSNTAPVPSQEQDAEQESPDRNSTSFHEKVPYLNYSTFSEPDESRGHNNSNLPHNLDPFDEEDWDVSMTSSLPTEFNLRPDVTPTGEEAHPISFETPAVRASPSHNASLSDTEIDNIPEETIDRVNDLKSYKYNKLGNQSMFKKEIYGAGKKQANKLYVIVRTSILSSLLLLLLFSCLVILVIESESDLLAHLRKLPEMVVLRRDYYEPIKNSLFHGVKR
ncbi:FERM domain-containing protein-like protein [Leptotrombidium deliense]|uniref:FERM domain-containing protein-like protein n=1 Tax=Leptotrombidium deliense TaxID=299467 RepID=A0A443SUM6_9ACAR|nr:FERM domain-containing protein-like protein [Leptotrombidium deliense]